MARSDSSIIDKTIRVSLDIPISLIHKIEALRLSVGSRSRSAVIVQLLAEVLVEDEQVEA